MDVSKKDENGKVIFDGLYKLSFEESELLVSNEIQQN